LATDRNRKLLTMQRRSIEVVEDAEALAHAAAERLIARATHTADRVGICLTGGSSPQRLYQLLGTAPYRSRLPWERIHWFMGDDRFVPLDDERSNMGSAMRTFLDASAPRENIHPIDVSAGTPDAAAQRYQDALEGFASQRDVGRPIFDLVLMGLGADGHTASLFPGAAALKETARWVVGVEEARLEPFVPRVTLTIPVLASTREMLFLVTDGDKRDVLTRVLNGADLPATRVRADGDLVWLLTRAAAPEQPNVS
jgi:6-phosphogluconolactonase